MIRFRHDLFVAVVLAIAATRALSLQQPSGLQAWARPGAGPETFVPDLATDDSLRLSWLPGVGAYRAEQIVAQRPQLQLPLTPERLALIPGVGETTAREVSRWYRRHRKHP